jgi:hypothetical protein
VKLIFNFISVMSYIFSLVSIVHVVHLVDLSICTNAHLLILTKRLNLIFGKNA